MAGNAFEILKVLRFCERFIFWSGYVRKEVWTKLPKSVCVCVWVRVGGLPLPSPPAVWPLCIRCCQTVRQPNGQDTGFAQG